MECFLCHWKSAVYITVFVVFQQVCFNNSYASARAVISASKSVVFKFVFENRIVSFGWCCFMFHYCSNLSINGTTLLLVI
jgi:hypothetical protein